MKNKLMIIMMILIVTLLAACNNETDNQDEQDEQEIEEPKMLEVEFELPEKADVGETVELKAIVTYGDEKVKDADEVEFEYWEQGNEDDSTFIESTNNEDGTYIAEVTFEKDGVYEIYAHTTARDLHTMPKKAITIGEGDSVEHHEEHEEGHEHNHSEGLATHFVQPEDVKVNQEIDLIVHLQMDNQPLEEARVRFQINSDGAEKADWLEAEETIPGEYTSLHSFEKDGTYTITIHIEDNEGLHEHVEQQIQVAK